MRKPKTQGLEWLQHSLVSFNGSGYADRDSAEAFLNSYIDYNKWKKRLDAVVLANKYYNSVLPLAEYLLPRVYETSHTPNKKNYERFQASRNQLTY